MLRGLWQLTWLEIKIFVREPLGVVGTLAVPVVLCLVFGRIGRGRGARAADLPAFIGTDLAVMATTFVALGSVMSLVAIIAIYREGGILKRLRATPLRPATILTAHVLVKLTFSLLTLVVLALAGRRLVPADMDPPLLSFGLAVLFSTACVLSIGFVLASIVPTARFAQPAAAAVLYPMLAVSGVFVPIDLLPSGLQAVARVLPLTYAVSLQRGIWRGEGWAAHGGDVLALLLIAVVAVAVANRVFRWE
ncbi:MAG: ABC transporter permease [Vicinamibacterales bacterium]